MLRNFHPKLWWVVIPFALVIFPPLGVLLAAIALCRTTSHWKVFGDRKMARRIARFDRERVRRARARSAAMESEETAATPTEFESDLEALAAEVYKARAQSPTEVTPERWASIKERFPGSARSCLRQARQIQEEEL